MSIYSTNRAGTVASIDVVANESYRASDIGRIMYESQVNDQAIFEATLAADFAELGGLNEGTLLESEVAAFNEANGKSLFAKLKERLMAFWAKIKGVFKAAIQKVAAYVLRDGKAFVKEFEAAEAKGKRYVGKIEGACIECNTDAIPTPNVQDANKAFESYKTGDAPTSKEVVNGYLSLILHAEVEGAKDFKEKAMEAMLTKHNIDNHDAAKVKMMKDNLSNGSAAIKGLKEEESRINKGIAELKKDIETQEKAFEAAAKETDAENKTKATDIVKRATLILGAFETVVSTITSAKIAATKTVVRESRKALGQMLSSMNGNAHHEAAAIAAEDEAEVALDDDLAAPADEDTQAEIEKLVAEA